jgi:hypothetical protein
MERVSIAKITGQVLGHVERARTVSVDGVSVGGISDDLRECCHRVRRIAV